MFLGMFGGLASAIVSNMMMISALYIVSGRKKVPYLAGVHEIIQVGLISLVLPIAVDVQYGIGLAYKNTNPSIIISAVYLYNLLRLISLVLNLLAFVVVTMKVRAMVRGRKRSELSINEIATRLLVNRIKYYPLVQALSRLFFTGYEFAYGQNFNPGSATTPQFVAQCLVTFAVPLEAM